MATTFQRARSDEQRAVRRQAILDTAAAMLQEMPVADISLNELSRRVGLAKSNVLRYFDSREDVLLQLLAQLLPRMARASGRPSCRQPSAAGRGSTGAPSSWRQRSPGRWSERPMLCDLISAQAAVLEHNVSVEAVTRYKLAALDDAEILTGLVLRRAARAQRGRCLALLGWRLGHDLGVVGVCQSARGSPRGMCHRRTPGSGAPRLPGRTGGPPHDACHRAPRPRRRLGAPLTARCRTRSRRTRAGRRRARRARDRPGRRRSSDRRPDARRRSRIRGWRGHR